MPELPEVESTVRYLQERIEGKTITGADVYWKRTVATHPPAAFRKTLTGKLIEKVYRRGKFICIKVSGRDASEPRTDFIFVHLRMSGSLDVVSSSSPASSHDRATLILNNGKDVRFNDTRKFGRIYLSKDPESIIGALGIEPLSPEFTPQVLASLLAKRRTRIKSLLLNQKVIAGLGNIYVDEVLWIAKINPLTLAQDVPTAKCTVLHRAIKDTLRKAISLLGTDFGDGVVDGGMYSPKVYGRDGKPCARCKATISKTTVGQRGTHFCPRCQRR